MAGPEQGDNIDAAAATRPRTGTPGGRVKVKDLIAQLSKLDQNLEVFCIDDGPIPIPAGYSGPFEIHNVCAQKVLVARNENRQVTINFRNDLPRCQEHALISITSDF